MSIKVSRPIYSSPELKAHVSFSDRLSSVVCLPVCLSVCLSVCKLFLFSTSSQEPLGQFYQTWHKAWLGKGKANSSLFKWSAISFPKRRYLQNIEITLTTFWTLLLKNRWANLNQTWHKTFLGKGDSSLFKLAPPYSKGS